MTARNHLTRGKTRVYSRDVYRRSAVPSWCQLFQKRVHDWLLLRFAVAVHAWPDPPEQTPAPLSDVHRDWHSEWEQAERLLTRFLASYRPQYPNVPVRQVATRDRPTRALRNHANAASLLVLGRHHRTTLRPAAHHSISNP
jgi:hypothetical protein